MFFVVAMAAVAMAAVAMAAGKKFSLFELVDSPSCTCPFVHLVHFVLLSVRILADSVRLFFAAVAAAAMAVVAAMAAAVACSSNGYCFFLELG